MEGGVMKEGRGKSFFRPCDWLTSTCFTVDIFHKINLHKMEAKIIVYKVFYHWNKIYFCFRT